MQETPEQRPEDVHVKLKPIFGIEPTRYLPLLYLLAIVIILFLLLVLPGLVNPGTQLTVVSQPPFAAVAVDGVIRGYSGDPVFVPAGERTITVSRSGHVTYVEERDVGRRLVGSLFFPRKREIQVALEPEDPAMLVDRAVSEFARWALVGEASGQYQFPPVARDLGRDLGAGAAVDSFRSFSDQALPQVNSQAQLNDILAGSLFAVAGGAVPGPLAVAAVVKEAGRQAAQAPGLPLQLASASGGMIGDAVEASAWYAAATISYEASLGAERVPAAAGEGALRTIASLQFVAVPAGGGLVGGESRAEGGGDIAYEVSLDGFLVARTETTIADYAEFVTERPEWGPENRSDLVARGLVDEEYLRDWEDGVPPGSQPVRNVSLHAAEAFAEWFAGEAGLPAGSVRLPTEAEWDYLAARDSPDSGVFAAVGAEGPAVVGESGRGSLGLYGVSGNLWEWTSTPFAFYSRYYHETGPSDFDAAHRVVRGGGWATWPEDFTLDDRGSMPPHWCSDAVGFRLVIVD